MVDMKSTPEHASMMGGDMAEPSYRLSLYLCPDEIEKLSLGSKNVGDTFDMKIKVKVTSKAIDPMEDTETECMTLTILEADAGGGEKKSPEDILYGS